MARGRLQLVVDHQLIVAGHQLDLFRESLVHGHKLVQPFFQFVNKLL